MTEPEEIVRGVLRNRLTDPNPNRIGDNWIQSDWPQINDLKLNNFPRISIIKPSEAADVFGLGSTTTYDTYRLQLTSWTKPDIVMTIDSIEYEGKSLAIKLGRDILEALRLHWITDIAKVYNYTVYKVSGFTTPNIDYEKRIWKVDIDISFEAVRI